MPEISVPLRYPEGLLEWAGHRSGGVRRLFDQGSGRPSGQVVHTPLLGKLATWASEFSARKAGTPRVILLVGGPGNGKTEAVEETIRRIEEAVGSKGALRGRLLPLFTPTDGSTVPRRVWIDISEAAQLPEEMTLTLVQDASVSDPAEPSQSAAALLVQDLEQALDQSAGHAFLACVNRGVLDDALIYATDAQRLRVLPLMESIVRAAGMGASGTSCWPLAEHAEVAIWPMDVESLLVERPDQDRTSPAAEILNIAVDATRWPEFSTCPAGERCPFCRSRQQLSADPYRSSLLRILRWYELSTGKRWSFRDLFTLVSFLLAGSHLDGPEGGHAPCDWAAELLRLAAGAKGKSEALRLASPFLLMSAQYQHALFGGWERLPRGGIRGSLRELKLESNETLLGLHHFLSGTWGGSVPATLRLQLAGMSATLDPALADPDATIDVSMRTSLPLREIDARFSRSVKDGLSSVRKYQCLTPLEADVLQRLGDADEALGAADVRRRRPATASSLQALVRDFACRVVRRTLGVRSGVVHNHVLLRDFERVVEGDDALLHGALKRVEALLNENDRFVVPLNTTFGQPMPPEARRVILTTERQRVRQSKSNGEGRPLSDIKVLSVGPASSPHLVPLTYDLFKSVRDLQEGMMPASLPRTVTALLDATRARIAGRIVRDEDQLDGAEIRVGTGLETIVHELGKFLVRHEGEA